MLLAALALALMLAVAVLTRDAPLLALLLCAAIAVCFWLVWTHGPEAMGAM
jgi:hypothetical protein